MLWYKLIAVDRHASPMFSPLSPTVSSSLCMFLNNLLNPFWPCHHLSFHNIHLSLLSIHFFSLLDPTSLLPPSLCLSLPLSLAPFAKLMLSSVVDSSSEEKGYNWIGENIPSMRVPKKKTLDLKCWKSKSTRIFFFFITSLAAFYFIFCLPHFSHWLAYLSLLLIRLQLTYLCWVHVCIVVTILSVLFVCLATDVCALHWRRAHTVALTSRVISCSANECVANKAALEVALCFQQHSFD